MFISYPLQKSGYLFKNSDSPKKYSHSGKEWVCLTPQRKWQAQKSPLFPIHHLPPSPSSQRAIAVMSCTLKTGRQRQKQYHLSECRQWCLIIYPYNLFSPFSYPHSALKLQMFSVDNADVTQLLHELLSQYCMSVIRMVSNRFILHTVL